MLRCSLSAHLVVEIRNLAFHLKGCGEGIKILKMTLSSTNTRFCVFLALKV